MQINDTYVQSLKGLQYQAHKYISCEGYTITILISKYLYKDKIVKWSYKHNIYTSDVSLCSKFCVNLFFVRVFETFAFFHFVKLPTDEEVVY